eukprot:TRINITY_DN3849_c0_g1_i1.p1 TRINITY_DN3849_c0_g1~~TRINITY_DN3849_c0_g1_i1.p1  ORF type:complete len:318 (-),score=43.35 TRINITY_DN3849_c0_g1_i1:455-1408(-)
MKLSIDSIQYDYSHLSVINCGNREAKRTHSFVNRHMLALSSSHVVAGLGIHRRLPSLSFSNARPRGIRILVPAKRNNSDLDSDLPFLLRMERLWSRGFSGPRALIEHLTQYGGLKSKKVAEVMQKIDRALFVPGGNSPYLDSPMPIGYNATISAPHMHALCLELLEDNLKPGMRALDVGSGTGYLTACFAMMVGPAGHAVGIEHIPELVSTSIDNVKRSEAASLMANGSLSFHVGDGRLGWPELAPYDAIHVGAAAPEVPKPLIEQLKPGGRLVIPVGDVFQNLQVIDKKLDGSVKVHTRTSVRYVPLTSPEEQLKS